MLRYSNYLVILHWLSLSLAQKRRHYQQQQSNLQNIIIFNFFVEGKQYRNVEWKRPLKWKDLKKKHKTMKKVQAILNVCFVDVNI